MVSMGIPEERKEQLRARWRKNETDYLRERRRKVDVSAFVRLKTIGHGTFRVHKKPDSQFLTGWLIVPTLDRRVRRRLAREGTFDWSIVCYETGEN